MKTKANFCVCLCVCDDTTRSFSENELSFEHVLSQMSHASVTDITLRSNYSPNSVNDLI